MDAPQVSNRDVLNRFLAAWCPGRILRRQPVLSTVQEYDAPLPDPCGPFVIEYVKHILFLCFPWWFVSTASSNRMSALMAMTKPMVMFSLKSCSSTGSPRGVHGEFSEELEAKRPPPLLACLQYRKGQTRILIFQITTTFDKTKASKMWVLERVKNWV